jgi:pimeloyl-ACP methyl ester carboxylesterase
MGVEWQTVRAGADGSGHGVLLLPGGLMAARSYDRVLARPELAGTRLVAATLPGHAGTPPPDDLSVERYAELATELAADNRCDVVVGFSMGATVALEMAASGGFTGPVVLLGISLSAADEPAFFRWIVRLGSVLGGLPARALTTMSGLATKAAHVPDEHRARMREDFARNDPRVVRVGLGEYLAYLDRHPSPATRLCDAGVPTWVVHAEKGDGDLTDNERRTLATCPQVQLVTISGTSYFLPDEHPEKVAEVTAEALAAA